MNLVTDDTYRLNADDVKAARKAHVVVYARRPMGDDPLDSITLRLPVKVRVPAGFTGAVNDLEAERIILAAGTMTNYQRERPTTRR